MLRKCWSSNLSSLSNIWLYYQYIAGKYHYYESHRMHLFLVLPIIHMLLVLWWQFVMIHFYAHRIYTMHHRTKLDRSFIHMNTVGHSSDEILSLTPGTIVCQKHHTNILFKSSALQAESVFRSLLVSNITSSLHRIHSFKVQQLTHTSRFYPCIEVRY